MFQDIKIELKLREAQIQNKKRTLYLGVTCFRHNTKTLGQGNLNFTPSKTNRYISTEHQNAFLQKQPLLESIKQSRQYGLTKIVLTAKYQPRIDF